jgi:hypothetical protein|tara:strand:+ start:4882 stop:5790 length:909 start_codon:yes stop_codon:yes gene_type:complete
MDNKICYVVNFYLADRRRSEPEFKDDKLYLVKKQIELLESVNHSLTKIIFNFNVETEHYHYLSKVYEIVPKSIQNASVEISIRENKGYSYGAWSDVFLKYKDKYDYYVFVEDDYMFIEPNWDTYLVNKFESYSDCGYLCMLVREPLEWCGWRKNAGNSIGISSSDVLMRVVNKFGKLPHHELSDVYDEAVEGQHRFSFSFLQLGYNLYDVRDDYAILSSWESPDWYKPKCEVWKLHNWNKKYLCVSVRYFGDDKDLYYICDNQEFKKEHRLSTYKEAINCYNNKINYWDLEYCKLENELYGI